MECVPNLLGFSLDFGGLQDGGFLETYLLPNILGPFQTHSYDIYVVLIHLLIFIIITVEFMYDSMQSHEQSFQFYKNLIGLCVYLTVSDYARW